jgi:hypothetical protein
VREEMMLAAQLGAPRADGVEGHGAMIIE